MTNLGQSLLCRRCRFWLPILWNQGHVQPCRLVRWKGPRHLSPKLDGERCNRYREAKTAETGENGAATKHETADLAPGSYQACDVAKMPKGLPYPPADWWRALIVFNYMTGWRVGEPLALPWDDVSLDQGTAITRHGDNKGNRDDVAPLHPVVVDHLRRIVDAAIDQPHVFPWPHHRTTLWVQFEKIQVAAGIHLPCHEAHEHSPRCHVYGFHDLRRAFATVNHETLSADALQHLMRHRSYSTTRRYVSMAEKIKQSAEGLYVPEVLREAN